jgi:hypothetical protein
MSSVPDTPTCDTSVSYLEGLEGLGGADCK